jgi:hypothetical protein
MNTGYTGPEPSMAVKAALSTASYASSWVAQYNTNLAANGIQPASNPSVNGAFVTPSAAAIWSAFPGLAPPSQFTSATNVPGTPAGTPIYTNPTAAQVPGSSSPAIVAAPTAVSGANNAPVPTSPQNSPGNNAGNQGGTNGQTTQPTAGGTDLFSGLTSLLTNPAIILPVIGIIALLTLGPGLSRSFGGKSHA